MSNDVITKKLPQEELDKAWADYLDSKAPKAREKLIVHYLYLVKYAVHRMMVNLPSNLDKHDLMSYGMIGLIQSLDKFDTSRNTKFETFAMTRVRGAILDELRAQDWMPRSLRKKAKDIEKAIKRIELKKGKAASEDEIAQEMNISIKELRKSLSDTSFLVLSLDYLISRDSQQGATLEDTIPDDLDQTPSVLVQEQAKKEALIEALQWLPERERLLITLYYYEGLTMKEIGRILEVTEARVCQLHSQAVHRMRTKLHDFSTE